MFVSCRNSMRDYDQNVSINEAVFTQTPRTFCAANTEDLKFVLAHIHEAYPKSPILGMGISMGG